MCQINEVESDLWSVPCEGKVSDAQDQLEVTNNVLYYGLQMKLSKYSNFLSENLVFKLKFK